MRRTFRRHIRKTLAQEVPPILQEAIFAFDKGEYGRAGELFEKLAETAFARGGSRAAVFYLKAGQARLFAGQTSLGMPSIKRGLELLVEREQFARLNYAGARIVAELSKLGLQKETLELAAWLKTVFRPGDAGVSLLQRPLLPRHCPSCGAAVRLDEVEWLDEVTAECAYCGSPIR